MIIIDKHNLFSTKKNLYIKSQAINDELFYLFIIVLLNIIYIYILIELCAIFKKI